ncbi:MAG: carboxypeptidase regulatory-like domain-containing protein [Terriglobales bacterium]
MTAFLWAMVWQTLLIALAAAALGALLRGQPSAARHRLFLGALLFAALLPAASAWLHLTLWRAASSGAGAGVVNVLTEWALAGHAAAGAAGPMRPASPGLNYGLVLGCLWAAAVLLQAAGLARRTWRSRRAWRQATPERVIAGVPVLRGAGGPFTLGWLRPRIVLPEALLASEAWTASALAHELAHVRRRDYLWAWLSELALLPLAWHPAARWLAGQAALEREAACDAAARAVDAAYPSHLLDIATALQDAACPLAGLRLARRDGLEQRIARLVAPVPRRSRARLVVAGAGLSFAVLGAWALGGGVQRPLASPQQAVSSSVHVQQQAEPRAPVPVGADVQAALCIHCPLPKLPAAALAEGIQGRVEMHVRVATDGAVTAIDCGIGNPTLLAAAEQAVRGWRYHPLTLNGTPIAVSTIIITSFQIPGARPLPSPQGLTGVVCAENGARVAGAEIVATARATGISSTATTDADGAFTIDLPAGRYDVQIRHAGFHSWSQKVVLPLRHLWLVVVPPAQRPQSPR